ncbi:hypothetical protein LTR22_023340 [Elasticomyces elasticus]|nr:hypothetical protein LTR22_023340 [Elasticomyces elasticus]
MADFHTIPLQPRNLNAAAVGTDLDYQRFRQQQEQTGPRAKPLSATTTKGLEAFKKRWEKYCSTASRESVVLLREAGYADFTTFFKWLVDHSRASREHAPQAPTLRQYFRNLLMWRERVGGDELPPKTRTGVNSYIDYELSGKRPTTRRKKNVMSNVDFLTILAFHYAEDPARYSNERQRVQFAMLLLIHAFSAARPCSTTNTNTSKARSSTAGVTAGHANGSNVALGTPLTKQSYADQMFAGKEQRAFDDDVARAIRYKDIDLLLVRNTDPATVDVIPAKFAIRVRLRHWKGELHKPQPKEFVWHQCSLLLACPVTHLLALALDDGALRSRALNDPSRLLALQLPPDCNQFKISWRKDCLETPLLRECDSNGDTDAVCPLSATQSRYWLKRLGENIGLLSNLTFYDVRRGVSNAIDGHAPDAVRNQILGHANGLTFDNHYLNPTIRLDVQNTFLRRRTEDAIMHTLTHMDIVVDRNVPRTLPPEVVAAIESLPEMRKLFTEREQLNQSDEEDDSDLSDDAGHKQYQKRDLARRIRSLRAYHRTRALTKLREQYLEHKNDSVIEQQLTGKAAPAADVRHSETASRLVLPERAQIAALFASIPTDTTSAEHLQDMLQAVQAMVALCRRKEGGGPREHHAQHYTLSSSPPPTPETPEIQVATKCQALQCLFCLSDLRLVDVDRHRSWSSRQRLWNHVDNHLRRFDNRCPHPACDGLVLDHVAHFKNHALVVHSSRLRPA